MSALLPLGPQDMSMKEDAVTGQPEPVTQPEPVEPDASEEAQIPKPAVTAEIAAPVSFDPSIAGVVEGNSVSDKALLAMGMDYINHNARNVEAATEMAINLRREYKKSANMNKFTKLAALFAESSLMAYYGYGAIEHYTGFKGTTEAVLANSAISAGISVTRAGVQYGLMKRGEESFAEGKRTRGMMFTAIGISLAAINSAFVALGFASKYVVQEQDVASHELEKLSVVDAKIHADQMAAAAQINEQIKMLDHKLVEARSGTADPRMASIDGQLTKLSKDIEDIRNDPKFNDGKMTEWDHWAKKTMDAKSLQIDELNKQKDGLLKNAGTLTPEQQQLVDATTKQRLALNKEIENLDQRFKPQFDELASKRVLWQSKLTGVSNASQGNFAAFGNMTILTEALANVAAISVANWWAATEGHKQETAEKLLAGKPTDPWARGEEVKKPTAAKSGAKTFMGYDFSVSNLEHMQNQAQLTALSKALSNPEAMRAELRAELTRQHGTMIMCLNSKRESFQGDEYTTRLNNINEAYHNALELLNDPEIMIQLRQITAPMISDKSELKSLPKGAYFNREDGQLRMKR